MSTVTSMSQRRTPRRIDNPHSQLGRTYLVLRDAPKWMQLHEIGDAILVRFEQYDSHAAISARIRDLRGMGQTIARREKTPRSGNARPSEYRLISGDWDGEGGAA